jgi:hypothetical protein
MEKPLKTGLALIVIVAFITVLATTLRENRLLRHQVEAERELIKQKDWTIDSLHSEEFVLRTQLMRVEITLEHLNEVDPKAFIEFSRYYDHETE